MHKDITKLWKQFEEHYSSQGYRFGYSNKQGMFYNFSVMDTRTGRAKMDQVSLGLHINEYKKLWWKLMKDFEDGKTLQGGKRKV